MKILVIQGSYRKTGNTAHLTEMIAAAMQRLAAEKGIDLEVETLHLGHMNIGLCRGCRSCFDRGAETCPHKDDVQSIREKLHQADGVIAACPVYVDSVNGIMKNWIDRMAFVCHRPEFAGKPVYLVATTGSSTCFSTLNTLSGAFMTWGFYMSGRAGFAAGAKMDQQEMRDKYEKRTDAIARKLLMDILEKKAERPTFFSLMMFRVLQRERGKQADSLDERYWRENGWLRTDATFYASHRANPVKVFLARLTGDVVDKAIT